MSSNKETVGRTIIVTVLLCIVCSVVVASSAVLLKPKQVANKKLNRQTNILSVGGMLDSSKSVKEIFSNIETKYVDLQTGHFAKNVPAGYDPRKAAKDPKLSMKLTAAQDIASIKTRPRYMPVYMVKDKDGKLQKIILPIHGYGLWSTLYGFIALKSDLNTVVGLGFYEQQETPGLGGEVDNPAWKALWPGKEVYGKDLSKPIIHLIKGKVDASTPDAAHKVDGLSGATLTSNGVTNLVQFWMGHLGYAPFLANLRAGEA